MAYYYVIQTKRNGNDWRTEQVYDDKNKAVKFAAEIKAKQDVNPGGHPYGSDVRVVSRRK